MQADLSSQPRKQRPQETKVVTSTKTFSADGMTAQTWDKLIIYMQSKNHKKGKIVFKMSTILTKILYFYIQLCARDPNWCVG